LFIICLHRVFAIPPLRGGCALFGWGGGDLVNVLGPSAYLVLADVPGRALLLLGRSGDGLLFCLENVSSFFNRDREFRSSDVVHFLVVDEDLWWQSFEDPHLL